jgi:hypothetical protein
LKAVLVLDSWDYVVSKNNIRRLAVYGGAIAHFDNKTALDAGDDEPSSPAGHG